jgi:hypothetical protein
MDMTGALPVELADYHHHHRRRLFWAQTINEAICSCVGEPAE